MSTTGPPGSVLAQGNKASRDIKKMFEGPGEEALAPEQRRLVRGARNAFKELEKLVKSIGLYGLKHGALAQFRGKFYQAFEALFDEGEVEVVMQISPYDLLLYQQSVYRNPNPESSFVYRFYLDGIRTLAFLEGLELKELNELIDVLLTDWSDPTLFEDDAVTLMWDKDWTHIRYSVVESISEDIGNEQSQEYTIAQVMDWVRKGYEAPETQPPKAPRERRVSRAARALGRGPVMREAPKKKRPQLRVQVKVCCEHLGEDDLALFDESLFAMDEQEFETLKGWVLAQDRETLQKFIEILFRVSLTETDEFAHQSVLIFNRIAEFLLKGRRVEELQEILRRVRTLTGPEGELLFENVAAIQRIFDQWGTSEFISALFELLDDPDLELDPTESVVDICRMLNPKASVLIATLVGRIKAADRRAAILRVLPDIAQGHLIDVVRLLRTAEAEHAHDLLRILKAIDHPDTKGAVSAAMANRDPGVRLEALSMLPPERLTVHLDYVLKLLKDRSKTVRTKALHLLARTPAPKVHGHLLQRVRDRDFQDVELDEKRRYFAALALTGDPIEYFTGLFAERSLLHRKHVAEVRACAAVGLALSMHRPSAEAFQSELDRKLQTPVVRDHCVWALQHMQADRQVRTAQLYDLFFKGELSS